MKNKFFFTRFFINTSEAKRRRDGKGENEKYFKSITEC